MTTRKELVAALQSQYRSATFGDRIRILDEFVALTGYHRKHAIRLLREQPGAAKGTRGRNRLYDEAVRQALTVLWEAADRVCGKRLKALIPKLVDAMERHGHLDLDSVIKAKLLEVSAATIDRMLANARAHIDGQRRRRTGGGSAIRRSIPVRTFADWRDPPPGFFEIDMVEHCGGSKTDGEFVHTLTLTDIASGWTECVAMRTRNQMLIIEAFDKVAAAELPFAMLGVDSDNDSAFMNQSVLDYCKGRGLVQTRSRAYKKNDQAWVEQKNGSVVRRLVGYGRLSGADARNALAQLYASSRLYINFFQPSFKLKSKTRDGARVHRVYFAPATPCDRLLAHDSGEPATKENLKAQFKSLDPVRLLQEMRTAQHTLSDFAAHGVRGEAAPAGESDVAVFLASLSSAWKEGEARPTHRKQPKAKHWWRSRVDPFADAWPLIEGWLIAEPSVPANVLMDQLAAMFPEAYASQAQLPTLQRRVKAWRAERVKELILGGLRRSADVPTEV
ncbi:integrase catalytic domain-containing protein [Paraburkholderia aspalathi]|uniref:Integrase core domain-containing protein n=1 Tax=Paraburkholderia aspalathi TaxID=1324617 RepID=A0A1I7EPK8_9BURK|nr:DDE-type integrase/transposase/recombinase [Paraburkholderia aspalathi]SFU25868.1 Integrase core domain-containing protein [Paraburkholderia aspalathi]